MKNSILDIEKPNSVSSVSRRNTVVSENRPQDGIVLGSGTPTSARTGGQFLANRATTARALLAVLTLCLGGAAPGIVPSAFAQDPVDMTSTTSEVAGININTASADELALALNGVGGSKALAIVRYREQFGAFESVDELTEVQGIGSAILERNRGMIRVN